MKICFLSVLYSDEVCGGGVKTYLYCLSRELCRQGHSVTIVTSGKPGEHDDNGVHIIKIGNVEIFENKRQLFSLAFLYKRLRYMVKATNVIRRHGFDIVEVPEGGCEHLFLVFIKPCPVITRLHGSVKYAKESIGFVNMLECLALKKSDGCFSPIAGYAGIMAKECGISPEKIRIIPSGIDVNTLYKHNSHDIRDTYNLHNKRTILFAGIMCARKGINVISQAAERFLEMPDILFVLAGKDTPYSRSLQYPDNVVRLGELSREALFSLYEQCAILLAPSLDEIMSYTILEAIAAGKAIVASDVGGIPELVIDNYNGILFKPGDVDGLVNALRRLLGDPGLLASMGARSKELSKRYDISKSARATVKFYEDIISAKKEVRGRPQRDTPIT